MTQPEGHPRAFRAFCWSLGIVSLALLILLSWRYPVWTWFPLLFFVPLAFLAGLSAFQTEGGIYISFESVICLQCALMLGPVMAAWAAGLSVLLSELFVFRRGHLFALRSTGMYILMWLTAGMFYEAIGGTFPLTRLELPDLLRALGIYVATAVVNRVVMALDQWLRGLSARRYLLHIAPGSFLLQVPFMLLGTAMVVAYTTIGPIAYTVLMLALLIALAVTRQLKRNSDLLRERVTALSMLNRVGERIGSSLEREPLLEMIYQEASRLIDTSTFWIVLYDRQRNELVYEILYDEGERYPPLRDAYRSKAGIAPYMIENRRPLLIRNQDEMKQLPVDLETAGSGQLPQSVLGVPMMVEGKVVGAIAAQSYRPNAFTQVDLETLTTLANQAAVALENAALFQEIEQSRQDLRAVLDGVNHAMVVTDLEGRVRLANRAMETLFGVSEAEAVGHPLAEVVTHEALAAMAQRITGGEVVELETHQVALSDGRVMVAHLSPVSNREGARVGYTVAMADVTALHELSELKSLMIRLASHDLRNPLHLAGGFFEFLTEDLGPLSPAQAEMARRVRSNLDTMRQLIDDLLNLERVSETAQNRWELVDLRTLAQEVLHDQYMRAELRRQTLSFKAEGFVPLVEGDRYMLRHALFNLVDNALKYTSDEGEIAVQVCAANGEVRVTVRDTGIGVPVADQPRVFDRFYRGHQPGVEQVAGTGLGLSLVMAIAQQHKGRVWVESEGIPGKGSTFGIALPAHQPAPTTTP